MSASSVMRRRRRGNAKSPSISDTEHLSDADGHTTDHPIPTPSDHYYHSEADDSDSPSPSGSTLPPPSTAHFTADLRSPPEHDLSDGTTDRAWYEFDLSVLLALLSPVVNWLTGSDHIKNILLIFLIVFYLHQIIEVPWSLYLASRPRHPFHPLDRSAAEDKHHRAALSELHTHEIAYLILSILSPFLGATLLRTVVISFSGPSTVSWFSMSLFVLATGMRPWKHVIQRLRQRTTDLHTIVHYPPSELLKMEALMNRVAQLEAELSLLHKQSKSLNSDMYEHVEDAIEMIEISSRRQEKKAEVSKVYVEGRLMKLEQNVEALLERMEIRADTPPLYRYFCQISTFVSALIDQLSPFLPSWIIVRCRGNVTRSPRSSPKLARSRSSIKLETIPEVATFQPKSSVRPARYLYIPGLGLVLRICGLAILPLRQTFAYLLAGRTHTSRKHAPVP